MAHSTRTPSNLIGRFADSLFPRHLTDKTPTFNGDNISVDELVDLKLFASIRMICNALLNVTEDGPQLDKQEPTVAKNGTDREPSTERQSETPRANGKANGNGKRKMSERPAPVADGMPSAEVLENYLNFMFRVILAARMMGRQEAPHEQVADLLDAIHNLPDLLRRWNEFDEDIFREFLADYDRRWHKDGENISLVNVWEDCTRCRETDKGIAAMLAKRIESRRHITTHRHSHPLLEG